MVQILFHLHLIGGTWWGRLKPPAVYGVRHLKSHTQQLMFAALEAAAVAEAM